MKLYLLILAETPWLPRFTLPGSNAMLTLPIKGENGCLDLASVLSLESDETNTPNISKLSMYYVLHKYTSHANVVEKYQVLRSKVYYDDVVT